MSIEYVIKSPCKINLHLDVHGKRTDGYHDLTSIFQLVSLEDEIIACLNDSDRTTISGDFDCSIEDNLIYKAVNAYKECSGINIGIHFEVNKKIPSGGGIGGGSSNCGAILRFLHKINPGLVTDRDIYNIALSLGSDVPFFLNGGTALVQGRGETVEQIRSILDYYILIVNPSIHISTGKAFNKLAEKNVLTDCNSQTANKVVTEYLKGVNNFTKFKNSFEIALYSDYNFIKDIKTTLLECGATYAALSGSGSTMFGVFTDKEAAEKAKVVLQANENYKNYLVKPLKIFPEAIRRRAQT